MSSLLIGHLPFLSNEQLAGDVGNKSTNDVITVTYGTSNTFGHFLFVTVVPTGNRFPIYDLQKCTSS